MKVVSLDEFKNPVDKNNQPIKNAQYKHTLKYWLKQKNVRFSPPLQDFLKSQNLTK